MIGRVVTVGTLVDASRLKVGSLVGVGWNGGYCNHCDACRKGDFAGCVTSQYSGFSFDGGHGQYMYAPETGMLASITDGCAYSLTNVSSCDTDPGGSAPEVFLRGARTSALCRNDSVRSYPLK